MSSIKAFYQTLFNDEERVCWTSTPYGIISSSESEWKTFYTNNYFCINPLNGNRKDANVTAYRNILVEFDSIPLEEQLKLIADSGLPYTSIVYSGGKSYHVIISLVSPCTSKEEYKHLAKRIYKKLGPAVDTSTSNPSRLSRSPGALRDGIEQKLMQLRHRVLREELDAWLGPEEIKPKVEYKETPHRLLKDKTIYFLLFGADDGKWNQSLFLAACDMARAGLDKEEIIDKCSSITGHLDASDKRTIESAWSTVKHAS